MKRLLQIILVVIMASLLGCASWRHTSAGNDYFAAGNYEMAVKEYEQALELEPTLAGDTEFQDRLRKARAELLYEQGIEHMERQWWDEAIERFRQCLKVDISHKKARKGLLEALEESSKAHLKVGLALADMGRFHEAADELALSLELDPDNTAARDALEKARKGMQENEIKADEHYNAGLVYLGRSDWSRALEEFGAAVKYNPGHVQAGSKARETSDRIGAAYELYTRGMELFDWKEWDQATNQFEAALEVSPFFEKPRMRIQEAAANKKQAENLSSRGDESFAEKRWDDAVEAYRMALDHDPNHVSSRNMLPKALYLAAEKHSSAGSALLNEGATEKAVEEFTSALEYWPDFSRARESLANIFYRQGLEFEAAGKLGNALIEFRKTLLMVPGYADARNKTADMEQRIFERTVYRVAMLPLSNRSNDPTIGENLDRKLLDALLRRCASHIQFVEPPELNGVMEYRRVNISDSEESDEAFSAIGVEGVDAIISGKVSSFEIYTTETVTRKALKYQSGTRLVKNYAYDSAQRDVWDLEDKVGRARDSVAHYAAELYAAQSRAQRARKDHFDSYKTSYGKKDGAREKSFRESNHYESVVADLRMQFNRQESDLESLERKLSSARNRLLYTDVYIEEPEYSRWRYNIYHVTKHCSLSVSCRIADAANGTILFAEEVTRAAEDSDDYVDSPNPSIGVYVDLLLLKGDITLSNEVAEPLVGEMTDHMTALLESYGIKYFELGNEASIDGDNEEAVEQYVNFLSCCPKCDPSDRTKAMSFIRHTRNYGCEDIEAENCEGYWKVTNERPGSRENALERM